MENKNASALFPHKDKTGRKQSHPCYLPPTSTWSWGPDPHCAGARIPLKNVKLFCTTLQKPKAILHPLPSYEGRLTTTTTSRSLSSVRREVVIT